MAIIKYMNPSGNITAIVRSKVEDKDRIPLAKSIIENEKAEQVGFQTLPKMGGDCRIEMMGGEFCANAVRCMAYLKAMEKASKGRHDIKVEVTGVPAPVVSYVDLDKKQAFVEMPLPLGTEYIEMKNDKRPIIRMPGIDHLILEGVEADGELAEEAVNEVRKKCGSDACGILFLNGDEMTPAVYVRGTESLVFESSCGSGSVAAAWYLAGATGMIQKDGVYMFKFTEPGGIIQAGIMIKNGRLAQCMMGGEIEEGEEEVSLS